MSVVLVVVVCYVGVSGVIIVGSGGVAVVAVVFVV